MDAKPERRGWYYTTEDAQRDRIAQLEADLAWVKAQEQKWREAYFDHMRDEHAEIVERVMRRYAEEKA